jgi:streptomycin 6-kinase
VRLLLFDAVRNNPRAGGRRGIPCVYGAASPVLCSSLPGAIMDPEMYRISDRMRRNVLHYFGEAGRDWLRDLPYVISEAAERWSLKLGRPFSNLSINFVTPATRGDGAEVVLKAGVPNKEIFTEISALTLFDGRGAVQILEADPDRGVMLLERLFPGTPVLAMGDDVQAAAVAAGVMSSLKRDVPADHAFPSVEDWFTGLAKVRARFDGGSGPFPAELLRLAERISAELLASMGERVLLHGDLHHENILKSSRGSWLAIDPKGVVGEQAYEVCAFLRNPMPDLLTAMDTKRVLARRIDQFSEMLGVDRARLIRWGLSEAVLSASWDIDDESRSWEGAIFVAETFAAMV